MESKILVPVDDSATARQTICSIIKEKERFAKEITLLYVLDNEQLAYKMIPELQLEMVRENARKAGQLQLDKVAAQLTEEGFEPTTILEFGAPRTAITNIANRDGYELVVIGRHEGGGEIRSVLFGSVANYVLHNVRCPVLLF